MASTPLSAKARRARTSEDTASPEGNELLTSVTGAALIVMLAVIGVTIIAMGPLLSVHLFIGVALLGPLVLKLAATGYRFARYYTGNAAYRAKGAPPTLLRLIAPLVILSTLAVMGTGVALLFEGPSSRGNLLQLHKISFFVWVAFMSVHVLRHLSGVAKALPINIAGVTPSPRVGGQTVRTMLLAGALLAGITLAIVLIPEYAPWLHSHGGHGH